MTRVQHGVIVAVVGWALATPAASSAQSFLNKLIIRQDINTKNDVAQPAFFQVAAPESKPTVVTAGLGILGKIIDRPLITFGPSFEYLRNTDLTKPVDSVKAGAAAEWQLRDATVGARNSAIVIAKANYVGDRVKDTDGFQALALYTHVFDGKRRWLLPNNEHAFHPEFSVLYSPDAGLEYENDGGSTQATPGHAVRAVAEVTVSAYPLKNTLDHRWEFTASISSRSDMVKTLDYPDREHVLWTAGVNFYLLKQATRTAGVGLTFTDGQDPSKGFAQQRFWQFGFRVQLK